LQDVQCYLRLAGDSLVAGNCSEARRLCRVLLHAKPDLPDAVHLQAAIAAVEGDLGTADQLLQRALRRQPKNVSWRQELASIRIAADNFSGALKTLSSLPDSNPETLRLRAMAFRDSEQTEAALRAYQSWLNIQPDAEEAWLGAGRCLLALNRFDAACEHASHFSQLDNAAAHELFAEIQFAQRRHSQVLQHRRELLQLKPSDADTLIQYAVALFHVGDTDAAVAAFHQAGIQTMSPDQHAAFLSVLLHKDGTTPQCLLDAHQFWARAHASLSVISPIKTITRQRSSSRRIRIGYLCPEPATSPIFRFLDPIFRNHDRSRFAIFLYGTQCSSPNRTTDLYLSANQIRDISTKSAPAIAAQMQRDKIDILVDVSGHFGSGTLLVSTFRPAAIQVAFPHYPCTTGLPQMDYIFTDRWTCPPHLLHQYSEQPYFLESGYLVFDPIPRVCAPGALPAIKNRAITFGLFQRPAKISRRCWDAIAQILRRVPNSRLLIHHISAELSSPQDEARRRILSELQSRGIKDPSRISFHSVVASLHAHARILASVDIALDSFPYTGTTTTCDCLWMGVPVVTLEGDTHVSRPSASLLRRLSLDHLVANSVEDYVRIATETASHLTALASLRRDLRKKVRASSLIDGRRLTSELEAAYQWMYRQRETRHSTATLQSPAEPT